MGAAAGDDVLAKSLSVWLCKFRQQERPKSDEFTIFMVPPYLRGVDDSAYEPNVVSIGPYHRGKEALKDMEERKLYCLDKFLRRFQQANKDVSDVNKGISNLVEKLEKEDTLRGRYSEIVHMKSDQFMDMLVLDGCFIIEFLMMLSDDGEYDKEVVGAPLMINPVLMDLLLLENQIPFSVLRTLFDSLPPSDKKKVDGSDQLVYFVWDVLKTNLDFKMRKPQQEESLDPDHLLHLVHSRITPTTRLKTSSGRTDHVIDIDNMGDGKLHRQDSPICGLKPLFGKFVKEESVPSHGSQKGKEKRKPVTDWIPSAVELSDAGIKFEKKKFEEDDGSPLDVEFKNGVVQMTKLKIFHDSKVLYRNLIAFEHCHPSTRMDQMKVTEYFFFIDQLIDEPQDAALLQYEGVLTHKLGSEENVASLFNRLCRKTMLAETVRMRELFADVNNYYNKRWPRWRKTLKRVYFNNPWSIISLFAAFILFAFTLLQTIFTIL